MTRCERAASQRSAFQIMQTRSQPQPVALVELITTVALALSTVVAATAVSIGIARADVFGMHVAGDSPLAIALLIGLLLLVMGGLTAIMADSSKGKS
jgi:hypothetical protein